MTAFIKGKSAAIDAALDRAAEILSTANLPVFAGLGTDMAGGRAAIRLAEKLGGVIDHMGASAEIRAMSDKIFLFTTPRETRFRADLILTLGSDASRFAANDLPSAIKFAAPEVEARGRAIVCLAPGRERPKTNDVIDAEPSRLPGLIAALTAAVKGHPLAQEGYCSISVEGFNTLADKLKAARFGVAIWSGSDLDALTIEALMGLIDSLNETTRYTTLVLPQGDNAPGITDLCLWTTGYPPRISFARGYAEHDPWQFNAARLIESGECDAVVWISAFRPLAPAWKAAIPVIALTSPGTQFAKTPEVQFNVGTPGTDHAGEFHDATADAVIAVEASAPSDHMSVADVIEAIALRLERKAA